MRFRYAPIFLMLPLLFPLSVRTQENVEREIEIHKNVRLFEMPIPQNMPEELKDRYQRFLPLFEEALKENTAEQTLANALTFRIVLGIKEIGSAKIKRAIAQVIAYRNSSRSEFVGSILLHSYANGGNVTKEEIGQFLTKQILSPLGMG